jgi:hypothetical protein
MISPKAVPAATRIQLEDFHKIWAEYRIERELVVSSATLSVRILFKSSVAIQFNAPASNAGRRDRAIPRRNCGSILILCAELEKCVVSCDSSTCAIIVLIFIVQATQSRRQIENPVRCSYDVRKAEKRGLTVYAISYVLNSECTDKTSAPNDEFNHIVVLFSADGDAMHSLGLEDAFRRDISRTLGVVEAQKWSFCGDQKRSRGG